MKWTKTTITVVIAVAAVLIGALGAAVGLAAGGRHAAALPAQSPAAAASPAAVSTAPAKTSAPAPQPTKTVTAPPQVIINNNPPAYQGPPPVAAPPPGSFVDGQDPANVVVNYYNDISAGDFTDAWNMGGSAIAAQNVQTYDSWVAGYAGTGPESASTYDQGTDSQGNEIVHTAIYSAGASSPSYTGLVHRQPGLDDDRQRLPASGLTEARPVP